MGTGIGFNKVIIYILPSKQKRKKEILFKATRTYIYVWLKLDGCSMCARFATQPRPKWLRQVKYFAKANNAFAIFELIFCKKIPLSRRVGYVMDGSLGQWVSE